MPQLESLLRNVAGSTAFATIDLSHAYWQILLHEDSKEIMSIQTPVELYTPNRILQGSTDAANHFQGCTSQLFSDISNNFIQWIDDFLLFADSVRALLQVVSSFIDVCDRDNLKIHAEKSSVFATSAQFCGRKVFKEGIQHDPRRIKALKEMPAPNNAGELLQFSAALN